ncbi:NUDIX hydrolase [Nitratireductor sp. CH_MIT9313-5]|uniref:NUDIX hydrolase n=1 Tax=Nitratireductor sp. CH_MIT9313-5 TaxID=3107764 RepID=UPI0030099E57
MGSTLLDTMRRMNIGEQLRRFFGGNPPRVQVAALPWRMREEQVEILLITSRDTGRWVLPKGWPEGRETLSEAAAREAAEEAGVSGTISNREVGRYIYRKKQSSGIQMRCEVALFALEVSTIADIWPEKNERTRRWVRPREAGEMVRESDLAAILASFRGSPRKIAA